MAVEDINPQSLVAGNGTRGPFPITVGAAPIPYVATAQIQVWRVDSDGAGEQLAEGFDYTITAGYVTLTMVQDVLGGDEQLAYYREQGVTQTFMQGYNATTSSANFNTLHDKVVSISQELKAFIKTCLRMPRWKQINAFDDDPATRANQVLGADANGEIAFLPIAYAGVNGILIGEMSYTGNGANRVFTYPNTSAPNAATILVTVGGVPQPITDYDISYGGGATIVTLDVAPANGAHVVLRMLGGVANVTNPSFLVNAGLPDVGDGIAGDYYFNTSTKDVYGPKTTVWGGIIATLTSNAMLNGTIAPVASDGRDGDFWINTTNHFIYGPKAAGAWPAGYDLKGASGAGTGDVLAANNGSEYASGAHPAAFRANIQAPWSRSQRIRNAQTGTTYAIVEGDRNKHLTFTNAAAIAVSLPAASAVTTANFADAWHTIVENIGASIVTITPATSTINGGATLVLNPGQWAHITSDDANYRALFGGPDLQVWEYALSDEATAITTGTAKLTVRAPYKFTLTDIAASLSVVSSSGLPTVNIKKNGATIFSTELTIDASEKTSRTAATSFVTNAQIMFAVDDEITFDIDVAGTGAKGLKVKLYGYRNPN